MFEARLLTHTANSRGPPDAVSHGLRAGRQRERLRVLKPRARHKPPPVRTTPRYAQRLRTPVSGDYAQG